MKGTTPRILSFLMALALLASAFAMAAGPVGVAEASTNNTFDAVSPVTSQPYAMVAGDEQIPALIGIAMSDSMIIISSTAGLSVMTAPPLSCVVPATHFDVVAQTMSTNSFGPATMSVFLGPIGTVPYSLSAVVPAIRTVAMQTQTTGPINPTEPVGLPAAKTYELTTPAYDHRTADNQAYSGPGGIGGLLQRTFMIVGFSPYRYFSTS